MKTTLKTSAAALLILQFGSVSLAQADGQNIHVELESGLAHDSTLAVTELDNSSNMSDTAVLLNAKISGDWRKYDTTVSGAYSYRGTDYQQADAFDLKIQHYYVDIKHDFDHFSLGGNYHHADAQLDNTDFLTLKQHSVYVSKLFHDSVYLRLSGTEKDKQFDGRRERNADNNGLNADAYWFFNSGKRFISAGIGREQEDAVSDEFDFDAISLKVLLSNKFTLLQKDSQLQLGWTYSDRDYTDSQPFLAYKRDDQRMLSTLEWTVSFNQYLSASSKLEYGDYRSDLADADYNETMAAVTLKARF